MTTLFAGLEDYAKMVETHFSPTQVNDPDWLKELTAEITHEVEQNIVRRTYLAAGDYVVWEEVWKKYTSNYAVSVASFTAGLRFTNVPLDAARYSLNAKTVLT